MIRLRVFFCLRRAPRTCWHHSAVPPRFRYCSGRWFLPVLGRREIAELRVLPIRVVAIQPSSDLIEGVVAVLESVLPEALRLQRPEEALDHAALRACRRNVLLGEPVATHDPHEWLRAEHEAVVRSQHELVRGRSILRLRNPSSSVAAAIFATAVFDSRQPTHDVPVPAVDDRRQVTPARRDRRRRASHRVPSVCWPVGFRTAQAPALSPGIWPRAALRGKRKRKGPLLRVGLFSKDPATSYSPTSRTTQYHRR